MTGIIEHESLEGADTMKSCSKEDAMPRGVLLCSISCKASGISEAAIIAYWMESREAGTFDYHRKAMIEKFHELADLLGCDVVAK